MATLRDDMVIDRGMMDTAGRCCQNIFKDRAISEFHQIQVWQGFLFTSVKLQTPNGGYVERFHISNHGKGCDQGSKGHEESFGQLSRWSKSL